MNALGHAWTLATIVDAVIAVTLLEGVLLWLLHAATGKGVAPWAYAVNMLAGLALMAALRCVVGGAAVPWTLLCLLLAGAAHTTDIVLRWQRHSTALAHPRPVKASA